MHAIARRDGSGSDPDLTPSIAPTPAGSRSWSAWRARSCQSCRELRAPEGTPSPRPARRAEARRGRRWPRQRVQTQKLAAAIARQSARPGVLLTAHVRKSRSMRDRDWKWMRSGPRTDCGKASIRRWWRARSKAASTWRGGGRWRRWSTTKGACFRASLLDYRIPTSLDTPDLNRISSRERPRRTVRRQGGRRGGVHPAIPARERHPRRLRDPHPRAAVLPAARAQALRARARRGSGRSCDAARSDVLRPGRSRGWSAARQSGARPSWREDGHRSNLSTACTPRSTWRPARLPASSLPARAGRRLLLAPSAALRAGAQRSGEARLPALRTPEPDRGAAAPPDGNVGRNLCLDTRCVYSPEPFWRSALDMPEEGRHVCHVVPRKRCVAAASNDTAPGLAGSAPA